MTAERWSITEAIIETIRKYSSHIEGHSYADILVRVQNGHPVMVEITSKHQPKAN